MDIERPDDERPTPDRDSDLVALEGLEAEFAELEAELAQVERSRGQRAQGQDPTEPRR